uniref:Peptidyl-prolyl cis-trans isomerase n=1 Tax=Parascaris univalens TaxID=6257 RepID=A0A915CFG3_PARUN
MAVLLETTLGDMIIDLFVEERPRCSLNFLKLCKMKYYNFCQFHTIEQNYIAQTGDPTGTGTGGESIYASLYGDQARYFEPEMVPKMRHTRMGLVSMVNNGGGMLGSQFFITLGEGLDYLDDKHTIFGQVTEGIETLEKLNEQICDEHNRPYKDIRIAHTIVLDDPFDDPSQLKYPQRSPSPTIDLISSSKIALDEALNEDEGKTEEEVRKEMEAKDMAAQAQILEMVGDLRHADERPPENVLFVCKLNPVTTDEDLEIIFSRFGAIKCCEVIRDRRTGASLQYAFIEFEDEKSCENAYFKMDNVLIDDRRIHVDFSQSVAKNYKWHRKEELKQTDDEKRQRKRNGSEKRERTQEGKMDEQARTKGRSKDNAKS